MKNTYVIALGGSIINPDEIDVIFLRKFCRFIQRELKKKKRFIIVAGGGKTARRYQAAAHNIGKMANEDKDWLGIHATRLNAHLLRTIFRAQAHPVLFESRGKIKAFGKHKIIVGAGWRPGWSTDYVAVQIAVDLNIKNVLILGKPDFVYDKDNVKFPDAVPLPLLTWEKYLKLIPKKWSPGLHAPVDPVAARLAQKSRTNVVVVRGHDLSNVRNILEGKPFRGTLIRQ